MDTSGNMEPRQEDANGWATSGGGNGNGNGNGNGGGGGALDVLIDGDACGTVTGEAGNYDGSYLWVYQERDVVDLLVILSGLPGGALETAFLEEADCDCDGVVTINDMLTFRTVFGSFCD